MGKIRIENKADLLQITEIHNQAFGDTEESQIVIDLRKNDNLKLSLVYENDGILVGHIAYSLIKNNNIDSDRIYISGLSMGGYGTFDLVSYRPDLFAAAAPICGGADLELLKNALDVPFWIFHGDADKVVPVEYSQNAFKLLVSKNNKHRYTEYKDVNHNSWDYVFKEEDYFKWMFSKSK